MSRYNWSVQWTLINAFDQLDVSWIYVSENHFSDLIPFPGFTGKLLLITLGIHFQISVNSLMRWSNNKKKAYRNTTEVALNYGRTLPHSTLSTDRTQLAKTGKRGYWCLFMYNVYHYNEDVTQWQSQQHQYPSCLFLIFFFPKRKTFHFSFASELRIFLYAVLYYSFNFL